MIHLIEFVILISFKPIVDMIHCLGCFVPEGDEGVLVHDEGVGEHVAARGGQQVDLLHAVQLELVEPLLARLDVALHLAELLELLEGVRVQLRAHVLHPHQRPAVLGAGLLHALHSPPEITNSQHSDSIVHSDLSCTVVVVALMRYAVSVIISDEILKV